MRQQPLLSISICVAGLLLTACAASIDDTAETTIFSVTTSAPTTVTLPRIELIQGADPTSTTVANLSLTFKQEMLSAVNAARAQARKCGSKSMPAVAPLTWNEQLQQAALIHSRNMAQYEFFSHSGLDGKEVSQRVHDEGYNWRAVGENIGAGVEDVAGVMTGWLSSPDHCATIMSADYTEMAAAVVTNSSTYYGSYWTQVFATAF